jgi:hypothetical protein
VVANIETGIVLLGLKLSSCSAVRVNYYWSAAAVHFTSLIIVPFWYEMVNRWPG